MTILTRLALERRPVTLLVILLVLVAGVVTYQRLERELFPEIEFPNIIIISGFPSGDPETVAREVTEPIEEAIDGMDGLRQIESVSSEDLSMVVASFDFGEDMEDAKRTIESNINGINFPDDVSFTEVRRINNNTFPVLQLSLVGDDDIPALQRVLDDLILPEIERTEGVLQVDVIGRSQERVSVVVDTGKLQDLGLSMQHVSGAISGNNASFPAGRVHQDGNTFAIRAAHSLGSLEDIRNLTIGFETAAGGVAGLDSPATSGPLLDRPVLLRDVAEVSLSTEESTTISRSNGKPSLNIEIIKDPHANTVDVTSAITSSLENLEGLPPGVEILEIFNDGPEVEKQLTNLLREGLLGFLFAILAVFLFLLNTRPSLWRGGLLTLRPTVIIGISIPLSILTGILIMGLSGLSLNFMSLAGLAIAVGRVVDDSIVVLENMYRHIQRGEDRFAVALSATQEVGPAIVSSTLTTVVVFVPLAFIQGLVGEFFTPFALSVSFALVASTLVALTAVPVLGSFLLRQGDFPEEDVSDGADRRRDTWLQRIYTPVLLWTLRHRIITILIALASLGGLALLTVVPITLFPSGTPQYLTISMELPDGTSAGRTFQEVLKVEEVLEDFKEEGYVEVYQATLGRSSTQFIPTTSGGGGFHLAGMIVKLSEDVPADIADRVRSRVPATDGVDITIAEISDGPPGDQLEITVSGSGFTDITAVALALENELEDTDGIINVANDVSRAREEVTIAVDPSVAAEYGLSAAAVGRQVNRFIVGESVTEVDLEGITVDVIVQGPPEDVDNIEKLKNLNIEGPSGVVKLGSISDIAIEQGPVSISRFNLERSASITGVITAEDTGAVSRRVDEAISRLETPPGVTVKTGGIFEQIDEGFADVGLAMAVGVVLVYLVMVATLGSLGNPLIIVLSLPLAVVGALSALAVTDRTLSLSALMGFLLLIGVVVTNAIVLLTFVEQLRQGGMDVFDALIEGGRTRVRPILMTAFTTTFALLPLAVAAEDDGGIVGAELATVVIGGLISSTFLTLIVVPVIYSIFYVSIPNIPRRLAALVGRSRPTGAAATADPAGGGD